MSESEIAAIYDAIYAAICGADVFRDTDKGVWYAAGVDVDGALGNAVDSAVWGSLKGDLG